MKRNIVGSIEPWVGSASDPNLACWMQCITTIPDESPAQRAGRRPTDGDGDDAGADIRPVRLCQSAAGSAVAGTAPADAFAPWSDPCNLT